MTDVQWTSYPFVAQMPHARCIGCKFRQISAWLLVRLTHMDVHWRTILAFRRCEINVEQATKEHVSLYVHDLTSRPNPRGSRIRVLDSGVGLANATMQQRLTATRLFYDYLMEEQIRGDNPVGRGRYTPGKGFNGARAGASSLAIANCLGYPMMLSGRRFFRWQGGIASQPSHAGHCL